MDFTREPIIETVITPREGYRLVVRSSKSASQEEHFVDALEVVSFGNALFFRCLERPKPFIVPVADYEVLEVREPRMVLKTPIQEKTGVLREQGYRQKVEQKIEIEKKEPASAIPLEREEVLDVEERSTAAASDGRTDRRQNRRRPFRRRRGQTREEAAAEAAGAEGQEFPGTAQPRDMSVEDMPSQKILSTVPMLSSILPPPTTLIRDNLAQLREQEPYKGAFFIREDKDTLLDDDDTLLEGLRSDAFNEENGNGDQEVSQEEPFCDPFCEPFFEESIPETVPEGDEKNKEDTRDLDA